MGLTSHRFHRKRERAAAVPQTRTTTVYLESGCASVRAYLRGGKGERQIWLGISRTRRARATGMRVGADLRQTLQQAFPAACPTADKAPRSFASPLPSATPTPLIRRAPIRARREGPIIGETEREKIGKTRTAGRNSTQANLETRMRAGHRPLRTKVDAGSETLFPLLFPMTVGSMVAFFGWPKSAQGKLERRVSTTTPA